MSDTIPSLLAGSVERDPDATWLRTDEGTLSFGGAAGQVARLMERFAEYGVKHGDLVVVTTRTTPPYLLCWLALVSMGAVTVPTDPAGTVGELTGLLGQVRPRAVVDRRCAVAARRGGDCDDAGERARHRGRGR